MSNPIKIGLFGFGRIGRNIFRLGYANPDIEFVAISDMGVPESMHYLLMRDSVHGPMDANIGLEKSALVYNGKKVPLLYGGSPGTIAWDMFGADLVIDATGKYRKMADLEKHLAAGARRVIIAASPEDKIDRIVIRGINDESIRAEDKIISTTSSTTQVLAHLVKILNDSFGLRRAMMTTVHAYTADQPLADTGNPDLRRSRSAVENIIPNETEAPEIVQKIMPEFKGKIEGITFNVPVSDGSCVDLTTELDRVPSVEEVNAVMKKSAQGNLNGIIGYTEDPIVSSDVIGRSETMIYDACATMITADTLFKTVCWYDNGWGFAKRILELAEVYHKLEARS